MRNLVNCPRCQAEIETDEDHELCASCGCRFEVIIEDCLDDQGTEECYVYGCPHQPQDMVSWYVRSQQQFQGGGKR